MRVVQPQRKAQKGRAKRAATSVPSLCSGPAELDHGPDRILKYRADTFLGQTDRYLVPEDKKLEVFQMVHEIPSVGHFGIHAGLAAFLVTRFVCGYQASDQVLCSVHSKGYISKN